MILSLIIFYSHTSFFKTYPEKIFHMYLLHETDKIKRATNILLVEGKPPPGHQSIHINITEHNQQLTDTRAG